MTLYEMTNEFLEVLEMAENPEIPADVIKDTLEAIGGEIEQKADGIAKVITELKGKADMLSEQIERLTARKQSINNNIKSIKEMLTSAMQMTGKTKFKTELFSFNVAKNPAKLIIDGDVPSEFLVEQEPKVDTAKIKELLKSGAACNYAHLEQSEGVRIR